MPYVLYKPIAAYPKLDQKTTILTNPYLLCIEAENLLPGERALHMSQFVNRETSCSCEAGEEGVLNGQCIPAFMQGQGDLVGMEVFWSDLGLPALGLRIWT